MIEKGHILIVDDDQTTRAMLELVLSSEGYEVRTADSGEKAVAAVEAVVPELILLDISMPDMSGFELLRKLKTQQHTGDLTVIFLSGLTEMEKRVEGFNLGAVDFIVKPFESAELLARVQTHLELRRLRNKFKRQAADLRLANELLMQEITDRKRAEEALWSSEQSLRSTLDALSANIAQLDDCGTILLVNRAWREFARRNGFAPDKAFEGLNYLKICDEASGEHAEGAARFAGGIRAVLAGQAESYALEYPCNAPGQQQQWFVGRVTLFQGAGPRRVVVAHEDITERKRAEEAMLAKNFELERFTYTVSHDLRSPLVTIMTFMRHLVDDLARGDAESMTQDISFINKAAEKMSALLEELLQLSRIGRVVNPCVETPLQELAQEALALVAGRIAERSVRVLVAEEQVSVYGDRVRLVEVFQNLIDNAVKFMAQQREPCIEIGSAIKSGEMLLFVRDNGMGIEAGNTEKVFDLFEKLNSSMDGSGMGLALAKRIVEVHGGRIWAESEGPGRGACFWISLPCKPVQG